MINSLLEYQKVDSTLREIEVALSKSEERKKASAAKNFLEGANETLAKLDQRAEELVSKYNGAIKLYGQLAEEVKEYDGIADMDVDQLSYVKKKAQSLTEEINNLTGAIEQLAKEIQQI